MRICVFTGSSLGNDKNYADAASMLGQAIATNEHELVYGGASVGLMGVVADAALNAGARVTGVLPKALADLELAHTGLSELLIVGSMHERKMTMAEASDAFIALPGGIGTLEELFEVWTWTQLGVHAKPIGLMNANGYFDPLTGFLKSMVEAGFVKQRHLDMLLVSTDAEDLLRDIASVDLAYEPKWIDKSAI